MKLNDFSIQLVKYWIWKETDVWKEAISFIEMGEGLASHICNNIFLKQGNF